MSRIHRGATPRRPARDLPYRIAGVVLLGAGGATSLLHRHLLAVAQHPPASALEGALVLTAMMLSSAGVLLVLHGRRLFAVAPRDDAARRPADDDLVRSIAAAPARHATGDYLAYRARSARAGRRG